MEKWLNATHVQVSNHVPDDIVFSILSKLPFKSLKRFECVSQSWSLLFDNSYFMTMYRNYLLVKDRSYYDGASVLIQTTQDDDAGYHDYKNVLNSLSGERCENMVKLDWPNPPFQEIDLPPFNDSLLVDAYLAYDTRFEMLGSVGINGTICLYCNRGTPLSFWNPVTHEFKSIPPSPIKQVLANNRGA